MVRMVEASLDISRAEKEKTSRHAIEEIAHVFAAHRANRFVSYHVLDAYNFRGSGCDEIAHCRIIYNRRREPAVVERIRCSKRFSSSFDYSLHHHRDLAINLVVERANRTGKSGRIRNDVECLARRDLSNGDYRRIKRCYVATDDCLQRRYYVRGSHDGIDRLLGHRAVPAPSVNHYFELVGRRHQRTGINSHDADIEVIPDVKADRGCYGWIIENSVVDHCLRAIAAFFGRLKRELQVSAKRLTPRCHLFCDGQPDRRVCIVSTRVHHTVDYRAILNIVLFLNRQPIHIGAIKQRWSRGACRLQKRAHAGATYAGTDFVSE